MSTQSEALKQRTFQFALDVLDLVDSFPQKTSGFVVGRQLAKAATAVAANYRATCVARSRAEFLAKLGVVVEEADESEMWTGISEIKGFGKKSEATRLHAEATALMKIFAKSLGTARANSNGVNNRSSGAFITSFNE
jgi:four helix bundle protein